ncbi:hypothetical protein M758_12G148800 [Ceratodon purpureus]|nr:hypothetical protein M758_12G148800 [Ceratodon purpureus]
MAKPRKSCDSFVEDWRSLWEPDLQAIAFNGATCDPTRVEPKVLQWAKEHCSHKPHFIKVINKCASRNSPRSCHLVVPSPFVKEHFRELQRVVTLENDEGETWKVAFWMWLRRDKAHVEPRLIQGWKRVADDNGLEPGEVVVFVLEGDSRFRFTRFDGQGNIIGGVKIKDNMTGMNLEESQQRRTRLGLMRASALALRADQCSPPSGLGFNDDGHEMSAPADKHIARVSRKGRRLCTLGEITRSTGANCSNIDESALAINNEHVLT